MHIHLRRLGKPVRPVRSSFEFFRRAEGARREATERFWGASPHGTTRRATEPFDEEINLEVDMKMVKGLVMGSAAALLAAGSAQAADLPFKAQAVEYVKVCSLYGAGFYYIPGTDTCIKIGGYLRAEIDANTNSTSGTNFSGAGGAANRFTNDYTWRGRSAINIDTRTATEYGVVRTFA